jgi:hypothetical protein
MEDEEGDRCGYWLIDEEERKTLDGIPDYNFQKLEGVCGGGCFDGDKPNNCAGNYVVIDHDPEEEGLLDRAGYRYTAYFHLQKSSNNNLEVGREVKRGDKIGKIGSSGQSMSPHLHSEVLKAAFDVGDGSAIQSDWDNYYSSLVDPFYSLDGGSNNRGNGGNSKWIDQCGFNDDNFGIVSSILSNLGANVDYDMGTGSINPKYLVTGYNYSEVDVKVKGEEDGSGDYTDSDSWRACGKILEDGEYFNTRIKKGTQGERDHAREGKE